MGQRLPSRPLSLSGYCIGCFVAFMALVGCAQYNATPGVYGLALLANSGARCSAPTRASSLSATTTNTTVTAQFSTGACPATSSIVRRSTTGFPATVSSGTLVSSTLTGFSDSGLTAGTVYYYSIFLSDSSGATSSAANLSAIPGKTVVAPAQVANGSIVIDGSDSDSAWSASPQFSFSYAEAYGESAGADNPSGYVRLAYDSQYFYFFIKSNDKYVHVDGSVCCGQGQWTDDGVEVFFDMGFERAASPDANDFHLIFTPGSPAFNWYGKGPGAWGAWTPTVNSGILINGTLNNETDTDTSWSMEVAIPLSDLGVSSISSGQSIGFTFWLNEDDTVGHAAQHWYPYTTGTSSSNPSTWGVAQF